MAVTVDWPNYEIFVPRTYMTLVQSSPFEIRELDTNAFRYDLRALEESEDGRPFQVTHVHNEDVAVGGITLADVLIINEPYTITFENLQYAVNLVGSNNNILERTNKNQVSVNPSNSAGLIVAGSGVTQQDIDDIVNAVWVYLLSGGSTQAQDMIVDILKKAKLAAFKL